MNVDEELLYSYDWPGNVRELRNLVERISILSQNENKSNITRLLTILIKIPQNLTKPHHQCPFLLSRQEKILKKLSAQSIKKE